MSARQLQWMDDPKPGFRWPVAVARSIAVPAEKLWQAISLPGNLELCHPFCAKNPVETWPGETSRDQVVYLSGMIFERRFRRWFEGIGYDLEIGSPGGRASYVCWRILPNTRFESALRIAVYPHVLQQLPVAIRWLPHTLRLRPMLQKYLSSVVRGIEWYLIRGEAVPRNQFGSHPWFSAPGISVQKTSQHQ